mmetsp:Transcript_29070/g.65037  ORF Transcript_29070/g.65037 Transcript_29070/m.65037 type:complete len:385 (-) Transcript_29070:1049-2203(-)
MIGLFGHLALFLALFLRCRLGCRCLGRLCLGRGRLGRGRLELALEGETRGLLGTPVRDPPHHLRCGRGPLHPRIIAVVVVVVVVIVVSFGPPRFGRLLGPGADFHRARLRPRRPRRRHLGFPLVLGRRRGRRFGSLGWHEAALALPLALPLFKMAPLREFLRQRHRLGRGVLGRVDLAAEAQRIQVHFRTLADQVEPECVRSLGVSSHGASVDGVPLSDLGLGPFFAALLPLPKIHNNLDDVGERARDEVLRGRGRVVARGRRVDLDQPGAKVVVEHVVVPVHLPRVLALLHGALRGEQRALGNLAHLHPAARVEHVLALRLSGRDLGPSRRVVAFEYSALSRRVLHVARDLPHGPHAVHDLHAVLRKHLVVESFGFFSDGVVD